EEGGGLAETWLTAWSNLFLEAKINEKGASKLATALIHSGASGVGLSSISLLKSFGHKVFTTVSTQKKADVCKQAGADTIIVYKEQDFVEIVKSAGGVDVILDAVGANYFSKNLSCLKRRGHLILIGLMSGSKVDNFSLSDILMKNLTIQGTTLRSRPIQEKAKIVASFREQVLPKFSNGSLKVAIDSVFKASQIEEATDRMQSNLNQGKIIISWS
ncbi:MAG: zinc-binding dehydrogenase, partial [Leptonema sp. (in: Bacteria)]|nr:zinc-binding dehydrogenase [Leptonema sp. (in: bacteria)]